MKYNDYFGGNEHVTYNCNHDSFMSAEKKGNWHNRLIQETYNLENDGSFERNTQWPDSKALKASYEISA